MNFQASFLSDSVRLATEKGVYTSALGYVTYMIAMDEWGNLENFFPNEDKQQLKEFALSMLERCFSNKSNEEKVNAFLQCDSDLKLGKYSYSICESRPVAIEDNRIDFVETYYLNSLQALILLEMMYSIRHNVLLTKCPNCSRFFIAHNTGVHYCDRIFKNGKTCRQLGAKKNYSEKVKADDLLLLYEKKHQVLYHRMKRSANKKEQEELAQQLSLFREYRKKYKTSQITPNEFKSILE